MSIPRKPWPGGDIASSWSKGNTSSCPTYSQVVCCVAIEEPKMLLAGRRRKTCQQRWSPLEDRGEGWSWVPEWKDANTAIRGSLIEREYWWLWHSKVSDDRSSWSLGIKLIPGSPILWLSLGHLYQSFTGTRESFLVWSGNHMAQALPSPSPQACCRQPGPLQN